MYVCYQRVGRLPRQGWHGHAHTQCVYIPNFPTLAYQAFQKFSQPIQVFLYPTIRTSQVAQLSLSLDLLRRKDQTVELFIFLLLTYLRTSKPAEDIAVATTHVLHSCVHSAFSYQNIRTFSMNFKKNVEPPFTLGNHFLMFSHGRALRLKEVDPTCMDMAP